MIDMTEQQAAGRSARRYCTGMSHQAAAKYSSSCVKTPCRVGERIAARCRALIAQLLREEPLEEGHTMTDNNIKPTKPVDNSIAISSRRLAEAAHYDELAAQAERWGHFRMEMMHREAAAQLRRLAKADSTGKPVR
jgi:hypothetical protein